MSYSCSRVACSTVRPDRRVLTCCCGGERPVCHHVVTLTSQPGPQCTPSHHLTMWTTVSEVLNTTPLFPVLWMSSCTVMCLAARQTLGEKVDQLRRTNPLSVFLLSLLYCYPGGIISALLQAQPPLVLLTKTPQLASFSLVWYLVFYTPLHTIAVRPGVSLALVLAQDWMRLREFPLINLPSLRSPLSLQSCPLFRGVASPEVLCHKEPAQKSKEPTQDSSLVLYGIRIVGFHARKDPILGALVP